MEMVLRVEFVHLTLNLLITSNYGIFCFNQPKFNLDKSKNILRCNKVMIMMSDFLFYYNFELFKHQIQKDIIYYIYQS